MTDTTDTRDDRLGGPEYNGWQNRETWAANLWITNDEYLYNKARDVITQAIDDAGDDVGPYTAANALEEWVDDFGQWMTDAAFLPIIRDIGSIWRVNWREIADGLTED